MPGEVPWVQVGVKLTDKACPRVYAQLGHARRGLTVAGRRETEQRRLRESFRV